MGEDTSTLPPPYTPAPPVPREPLDCWACAVLITAHNLLVGAANLGIFIVMCGGALVPSAVMLLYGFLCHPRFRKPKETLCPAMLTPAACVSLLVFGVLLVLPFLILGLAGYARIVRCFQLSSCFLPYSRAMYQGTPPQRPSANESPKDGKAWV
ncbi:transmembrane protein 88 [Bufo gargarizans]|uniref:transmembrane protein 88 n=1 Tax=Bufo gargarizans TaxID=30331 RepID=UPI001CF19EBD|nr:transmembrane protein 88 [Bufo gargarizans]